MWLATLLMALREVRRNAMRSSLTALGIIIGVSSVIALVTLGRSATESVKENVSSLGANMLTLVPGADRRGPVSSDATSFTMDDVRAIAQEFPTLAAIAPSASKSVLAVNANANFNTVVYGTTNDFLRVRSYKLARGRDFSDAELAGGTPACVLGETVRKELFGTQEPVDAVIRLGSISCRVVGLVASKGRAAMGPDQDDFILMPIRTVQRRLTGSTNVGSIYVSATTEAELSSLKPKLEALFRERRSIRPGQKDDFSVQDTREIANALSQITTVLTALLGAVAAVSLLVGGIGIMNIMLVSVTERTREIGTRLAIGAMAEEVLAQFLVEAVLLCMFGGLAGVALGLGGSFAATRILGMPFAIDLGIVAVALVFSGAIGLAFGYLPARRAARLDPIEALRHE